MNQNDVTILRQMRQTLNELVCRVGQLDAAGAVRQDVDLKWVLVRLTAKNDSYGLYNGYLIDLSSGATSDFPAASAALAQSDLGGQGTTCIAANLADVSRSTWTLSPDDCSVHLGVWWGLRADGTPLVLLRESSGVGAGLGAPSNAIWYRFYNKAAGDVTYHLLDDTRDYRHHELLLWMRIAGLFGASATACKDALLHNFNNAESVLGSGGQDILVGFKWDYSYNPALGEFYGRMVELTTIPAHVKATICIKEDTGALYLRVENVDATNAANHYITVHVASLGEINTAATWTTI